MIEKTISCQPVFQGRVISVEVLEIEKPSGLKARREIVRHPGAAVILPQLPDGRFVLVRQYRKAVEMEMLEIVAGTLEPGEAPDDCAHRELQEETGYRAQRLVKMGLIYPAAGYTSETFHTYYALLDAEQGLATPDRDEDLVVEYLTAEQIDDLIRRGAISDGKTLAAWMMFERRTGF